MKIISPSNKPILYVFIIAITVGCLATFLWILSTPQSAIYNFRSTLNPLKLSRYQPNLSGLDTLNASASGHLSKIKIEKNLNHYKRPLYVVDVRLEPDYFIKGIPVGWLGMREQNGHLVDLYHAKSWTQKPWHKFKWGVRRLVNLGTTTIDPQQLTTEIDFLKPFNIAYYCCGSTRHHVHGDALIQEFITFLDHLPRKAWLHFHCATGRGRSTTFMVLYDIYRNHARVSLDDIILRQHMLGGENILDVALRPKGTWTKTDLLKRKELAQDFYNYMNDPDGYGHQSWTNWKQKCCTN